MQTLVNAYDYLYYRMYAWNLRMWGEGDLPQYNVAIWLTLLSLLNLLNVLQILEIFLPWRLFALFGSGISAPLSVLVLFGLIHYLIFLKDSRFKKFERKFQPESAEKIRRGFYFLVLYQVGTVAVFFGLVWLRTYLGLIPAR